MQQHILIWGWSAWRAQSSWCLPLQGDRGLQGASLDIAYYFSCFRQADSLLIVDNVQML